MNMVCASWDEWFECLPVPMPGWRVESISTLDFAVPTHQLLAARIGCAYNEFVDQTANTFWRRDATDSDIWISPALISGRVRMLMEVLFHPGPNRSQQPFTEELTGRRGGDITRAAAFRRGG